MEKIYIRADANSEIGTGHVMRCLSIAKKIRELQTEVIFIVADQNTAEFVSDRGYKSYCLDTAWNDMESEIDKLKEVICQKEIKRLFIDDYCVTENYLYEIGKVTDVFYMDDLDAFLYPVTKLINYNIYAKDMQYEKRYSDKGLKTDFFLGTKYVPLRDEFEQISHRRFTGIKRILITSGGTDKYNMIGSVLDRFIREESLDCFEFFCVIGYFNVNKKTLMEKYTIYENVHLLCDVSNMSDYMKQCDFCITAGGSTVYELCACGTPSVLITIADNQLDLAHKVSEMKLIPWVGDARKDIYTCLDKILTEMEQFKNRRYWECTSKKMQELVDGQGARRIAEELVK